MVQDQLSVCFGCAWIGIVANVAGMVRGLACMDPLFLSSLCSVFCSYRKIKYRYSALILNQIEVENRWDRLSVRLKHTSVYYYHHQVESLMHFISLFISKILSGGYSFSIDLDYLSDC